MAKPKRFYLAKSADTGRCGNKSGLPPRVGVSLAVMRLYGTKPGECCKNKDNKDCKGPSDRKR